MARIFEGKTFLTLSEWLALPDNQLPDEMRQVTIPTLSQPGYYTFADVFGFEYGDRYLFTNDTKLFNLRLIGRCFAVLPTLSEKLANLSKLVADFLEDSEEETTDTLRSPNGALQTSGFSAGGILRKRSGGASGDTDRLLRYQNERRQIITEALEEFAPLFIAVSSDWGCPV